MTQTIKLKRSAVASNVPTTGQVDLGEVAINTNDGAVYLKRDSGTPEVIAVHHDDTLYLDYTNNRVGIGTRTPSTDLDIGGAILANKDSTGLGATFGGSAFDDHWIRIREDNTNGILLGHSDGVNAFVVRGGTSKGFGVAVNNTTAFGGLALGDMDFFIDTAGTVNIANGALQTAGTTRLDNSGNLTNIGTIQITGTLQGPNTNDYLDFDHDVDNVFGWGTTDNAVVLSGTTHMAFVGDSNSNGTGGIFDWGYGDAGTASGVTRTMSLQRSGNLSLITGDLLTGGSTRISNSGEFTGTTLNLTGDSNQIVLDSDAGVTTTLTDSATTTSKTLTLPDETGTLATQAYVTAAAEVSTNVETLSADKTLTNSDDIVQILNPNGAARNVDLPAEEANLRFIIKNNQSTSSANTLTIRDDAGVALNLVLGAEQACEIVSDGISWFVTRTPQSHELSANGGLSLGSNSKAIGDQALAVGISASSSATYGVALGSGAQATATEGIGIGRLALSSAAGAVSIGVNSDATQNSAIAIGNVAQSTGTVGAISIGGTSVSSGQEAVALGQSTDATSTGAIAIGGQAQATTGQNVIAVGRGANASGTEAVSIGYNSVSSNVGTVAIGGASDATQNGAIAIGSNTEANSELGIALGLNTITSRVADLSISVDGDIDNKHKRGSAGYRGYIGSTTFTELFLGDVTNARFTIAPQSIVVFQGEFASVNQFINNSAAYLVKGSIIRDGSNNTTLKTHSVDVLHEDAGYGIQITADDTNEALKVEVKTPSVGGHIWTGQITYVEATL